LEKVKKVQKVQKVQKTQKIKEKFKNKAKPEPLKKISSIPKTFPPSIFSVSLDVEKIAENVDNFINSLNFSSQKTYDKTRRFVDKSREFFNETRDFKREKSPIFNEKMTDTQELEIYQQMFENKNKNPQKELHRKVDSDQQTEFIDHFREKSPVFFQGIDKKPMNFPLNVKDLYKSKNKYGFFCIFNKNYRYFCEVYDEKEFEEANKAQSARKSTDKKLNKFFNSCDK